VRYRIPDRAIRIHPGERFLHGDWRRQFALLAAFATMLMNGFRKLSIAG